MSVSGRVRNGFMDFKLHMCNIAILLMQHVWVKIKGINFNKHPHSVWPYWTDFSLFY